MKTKVAIITFDQPFIYIYIYKYYIWSYHLVFFFDKGCSVDGGFIPLSFASSLNRKCPSAKLLQKHHLLFIKARSDQKINSIVWIWFFQMATKLNSTPKKKRKKKSFQHLPGKIGIFQLKICFFLAKKFSPWGAWLSFIHPTSHWIRRQGLSRGLTARPAMKNGWAHDNIRTVWPYIDLYININMYIYRYMPRDLSVIYLKCYKDIHRWRSRTFKCQDTFLCLASMVSLNTFHHLDSNT